jgi:hypothetical protein
MRAERFEGTARFGMGKMEGVATLCVHMLLTAVLLTRGWDTVISVYDPKVGGACSPYFYRNFTVYDMILYHDEAHSLLLRLRLLDPYVDHFVIGYSTRTFQGQRQPPMTYEPLTEKISAYGHKLIPFEICCDTSSRIAWRREGFVRDTLKKKLDSLEPDPDSLIIGADVDEFPLRRSLEEIYAKPPATLYKFSGLAFQYSFRHISNVTWDQPGIFRYSKMIGFDHYRIESNHPHWGDASLVHCSYCFPELATILAKLQAFSHKEYSVEPWINPSRIIAALLCERDIFNRKWIGMKKWEGNVDELQPFDDPELQFFKDRIPFKDVNSHIKLRRVKEFLLGMDCPSVEQRWIIPG